MKIGVITITDTHYFPVSNLTMEVNNRYCKAHGYDIRRVHFEGGSWPEMVWEKIPVLRDNLAVYPAYDWLMWIDGDAMVMNHSIRLERLIDMCAPPGVSHDLIICPDYPESGKSPNKIGLNCGVFLIRNCDQSHKFLANVDALKQFYLGNKFPEQEAMEDSLQYISKTYLPYWLLNSFWCTWMPGDFIVHHAGGSVEDKVKGLTPFLSKVQYI